MSGIGFSEFLILCMIGLIVLGPKRLPKVANQIGTWVGQARRMTRIMRRQLEEELDFDTELNIRPSINPAKGTTPRDDDTYSPLHAKPAHVAADVSLNDTNTDRNEGPATDAMVEHNESDEAGDEQRRDA